MDIEEQLAKVLELRATYCGTWWRHFKGGRYMINGFSVWEKDGTLLVHYLGTDDGNGDLRYFSREWDTFVEFLAGRAWEDDAGEVHYHTGPRYLPVCRSVRLPYDLDAMLDAHGVATTPVNVDAVG